MSAETQESGGITANRRDVLRTAGGLAVATALAGALFDANTNTASAQKGGTNIITVTPEGLTTGAASFPALSFSFGASNSGSAQVGGGMGAGKVSFQDVSLTKFVDVATVGIFDAVTTGRLLPKVTIIANNAKGTELAKIVLEEVAVLSQAFSAGADGVGTESVSFNFAKITITVGSVSASWNVARNASQ